MIAIGNNQSFALNAVDMAPETISIYAVAKRLPIGCIFNSKRMDAKSLQSTTKAFASAARIFQIRA